MNELTCDMTECKTLHCRKQAHRKLFFFTTVSDEGSASKGGRINA